MRAPPDARAYRVGAAAAGGVLGDWPGNIRELQNVIERSVILSPGEAFAVDELWLFSESAQSAAIVPTAAPFQGDLRSEREMIEAALAGSRGRVSGPSGAAAKLGIPPLTTESKP